MGWIGQDMRYAARGLMKDRGFAAIAIVALALGIGATTVIFSVIEGVLLNPFPYKNAKRLTHFFIHDTTHSGDDGRPVFSPQEFLDYREQNHAFEATIGITRTDILYAEGGGTEQVSGASVTPNTFDVLGVKPLLGRGLTDQDAKPGAAPVFVISYRLWEKQFGRDPQALGRVVVLNGVPRTLVGIMPPRFLFWAADMWLPLGISRGDKVDQMNYMWELGLIKPGVSLQAAASDLEVIARREAKLYPAEYPKQFSVRTRGLVDGVVGPFKGLMFILMTAVSMLLLIACSNVANLLLARATSREKEIAVRASLGASRGRLIRQLLVESFVLAAAGCLVGCMFAYAGLIGVVSAIPPSTIPIESEIRLNPAALLFAVGVTLVTTLLCGLAPALHSVGGDLNTKLKDGSKGGNAGYRHSKFRAGLVIGEVALSIVLLVGAGLMMRSFFALTHVNLGFETKNLLVARLPFPQGRYQTAAEKHRFFQPLLRNLKTLPGVVDATVISDLPPYGGMGSEVVVPGKTHAETWNSVISLISEGYPRTLGLRLLRGRLLTEAEIESAARFIVVNQTLAQNFFGSGDPLGQKIKFKVLDQFPDAPHDAYFEIVGVIADAKNRGLQEAPMPQALMPYTITGVGERGVLMKTAVEPNSLLPALRREVFAVDQNVAIAQAGTLESYLKQYSYATPQFGLVSLTIFAGIGLALVAIGVFSVMAYTVSLQTHEIGVRMALGAQQDRVLGMVLGKGLGLVIAGIMIGELASLALARVIRNQLWGVSANDPLTFGAVSGVLIAVGVIACFWPARRATQVDPMVALRYE